MNSHDEKLIKDFLLAFADQKESQLNINWIIPTLIFSRKLFKNQNETKKFTKEVLGIEYKDYVYRSRAMLTGKILKDIMKMDSPTSLTVLNNLITFIKTLVVSNIEDTEQLKDTDSFFSEWSNFLKKTENPTSK
ncbi:hypothetical protein U1P98_04270 [Lysinibacillus irui]|uniref:Uncharacterized protein n=1 Tax=Lysinibacillus irui TaxID=2998077 RepID=A0ABU5NHK3_9BACI|nr:hypothetical protein [Lysinibacillus irui]MEA0552924.1 hypothetical protein [Lysinibacillus irui]MEA0975504.1 hypothetical protein [Lysinibacillus irui]MEA1041658.1 hypothetical protein [Lysinibacillus irui]